MRKFRLILALSMLIASVVHAGSKVAQEQGKDSQVIYRAESQRSFKGPEEWYTGVLDGNNVIWNEKVTDEQCLGK